MFIDIYFSAKIVNSCLRTKVQKFFNRNVFVVSFCEGAS